MQKTIRFGFLNVLLFGIMGGAIVYINAKTPTGLVPNEDTGSILIVNNLMPGAALSRTHNVSLQVSDFVMKNPLVEKTGGLYGLDFITGAYKTDAGISFVRLADWSQRPDANQTSQAIAGAMMRGLSQNKEAMLIALTPPPIMGMSTTGGLRCTSKTGQLRHSKLRHQKRLSPVQVNAKS